jgi:hypothetical protein
MNSKYTIDNTDLSEQYLLDCTKNSGCDGGYLEYAFETGKQIPTEQKYPYNPFYSYYGICSSTGIWIANVANNYYNLNDNSLISLLQDGPVAIAVSSVGWTGYASGILQCTPNSKVDHAVLLIGYTPTYWIIKNQWGTTWGMAGYGYITRNTNTNCRVGISAFTMFELNISIAILVFLALILIVLI